MVKLVIFEEEVFIRIFKEVYKWVGLKDMVIIVIEVGVFLMVFNLFCKFFFI